MCRDHLRLEIKVWVAGASWREKSACRGSSKKKGFIESQKEVG